MTDADLSKLRELVENIGPLPIDPDWMYTVIRHGQRNMDIDVADGFNEPERQSGYPMGELINALPSLLSEIERLTAERDEALASARTEIECYDHSRRTIRALQAELTTAREALEADKARLDFLDECNHRLNAEHGTNYGWTLILNNNVNRLMLGHMDVDLHDSEGGKSKRPSCRAAIDERMKLVAAARAALRSGEKAK